ncbi:carotenoid oxygenase family protein [Bradyrhizobium sp. U87765 SZCCT0131]|uniref:carotenoid oxygenase family protein n=1 Tax=unclassified Bradyrhizobium TaxID=2631580 RepID=UPI001BACEB4E|nr:MULTISPECIES: carotenoid oxygenase family protein [unclassified Bradyrhizobium]MBR1217339.1 carotenoid oxygenase family protein [Bradyrhizobium sp. U87765 SZCCT0131]MBR1265064.1 carotenoid oxygenase family protein [Bradyrhizobium sp. U87765 SZCCT0134]MBR1305046.1 carotenoid oxygenase family protein [Bradyrhizobium sp. U87765 SZCCT0110]MBR1320832.1 carotenoid oxygenase family protein [Bradyrhizobium sp. U87765 SZCCT0109]MBR1349252.1 carotenoid oxygenase family protein [Bradyrhizobium sp. U87
MDMHIQAAKAAEELVITRANVRMLSPDGRMPPDAPEWIWSTDHPYLHGPFAPTSREYAAEDLEVEGEIPSDLYGAYVMNGPSQRFAPANKYHYYDGDAMLRAIYFRDGKASFRQRWVRNEAFVVEDIANRSIWPGIAGPYNFKLPGSPIKDVSNTDVIFYAGKLLSLWHMAGHPYDIDPLTLETKGKETFGGALRHTLSAHSKVDPADGHLYFFTYSDEPPYMRYGVGSPTGQLLHDVPIDIPGPRSPHDLGLTARYAILHDLPFFHDVNVLRQHGKRVVRFHREVPARFGIIPRRGQSHEIRWFEAEPCYILHLVNCWEEGDWVHQVGCRQADPGYSRDPKDRELASMLAQRRRLHQLYKWSFNMVTGEVREGPIDDLNTEFPTVNHNFMGRPTRYSFNQVIPLPLEGHTSGQSQTFDALVRYDLETGGCQRYDYGEGVYGNEAPVAPRRGATADTEETAAYPVTFVTDTNDWSSACLIFDARDISRGPVAKVKIPHRISLGFHTTWVDGKDIFE